MNSFIFIQNLFLILTGYKTVHSALDSRTHLFIYLLECNLLGETIILQALQQVYYLSWCHDTSLDSLLETPLE